MLEIMKYNKKLQKRFNLNINNYKEYSQLYSSIEIELKLDKKFSGKFINIPDSMKDYYHIYFDNSKEETNKTCLNKNEKIEKIKIIIDYQIDSFKELFSQCKCINSIIFKKFCRTNIIDMCDAFDGCSSLKNIELTNFCSINVTNMSGLFYECRLLKKLNLSKLNTKKVIDMTNMFGHCKSLKELNLSNFDTSNVTNM